MFLTKFLLLVITVSCPAFADLSDDIAYRITNGYVATNPREYPYIAALENDGKWVCAAIIISPKILITAGMCTDKLSVEKLTVRVGSVLREDQRDQHVQVQKVAEVKTHPDFRKEGYHDYDISLLVLEKELQFNDRVNKINLVDAESSYNNVVFLGWGKDAFFRDNRRLMRALGKIISNEACEKAFDGREKITDSMQCASSNRGQVICRDSGSPAVVHYPEDPKKDLLVGVATHSEIWKICKQPIQGGECSVIREYCDITKPSIFTKITAALSWIKSNLN